MLILFCYRAVIKNLLLFMNRPVNLKRKIYKAQLFCTSLYAKSCILWVLRMAQCMTGTCNAPAKRYPTCWILLFLFNVIILFCWARFFQLNSKSVNSMRIFPVTSSAPNVLSLQFSRSLDLHPYSANSHNFGVLISQNSYLSCIFVPNSLSDFLPYLFLFYFTTLLQGAFTLG